MSEALGEDGGENEFAKDRKHDEGMRGGVSEGRRGGELGSGSSRERGRLQRSRILRVAPPDPGNARRGSAATLSPVSVTKWHVSFLLCS